MSAVTANMPPRQESVYITVHRADLAHKRVTADAAAEPRTEPEQKQGPRSGQQPLHQRADAPGAGNKCAPGARGPAGSKTLKGSERAAKTAGGHMRQAALLSKNPRKRQPGSRGTVSGATSGGVQRLHGSSSGDAATAAAAAKRAFVRWQTEWEVKSRCAEAKSFIKLHCKFDAEGMLADVRGVDSMMVAELHELKSS